MTIKHSPARKGGKSGMNTLQNSGIAAEFYVAAELARNGWSVVHFGGNFPNADLCIEKNGKQLWIQVKSAQPEAKYFILKTLESVQKWIGENKWYIFVHLDTKHNCKEPPRTFYCIPSSIVSKHAIEADKKYYECHTRTAESGKLKFHVHRSTANIAPFDEHNLDKSDRNFDFKSLF